jgi:hypothetical protein
MTDHIPDIPYQDEDTPEQQARCRTLELMVLLRALLDACWDGDENADTSDMPRTTRGRHRMAIIRRRWARAWFLDPWPPQRRHVDDIAACAGLQPGAIWVLVDRFIVQGEDPREIVSLYELISDRPGAKKFDLSVSSGV